MYELIHGDCLDEMRKMADNSIDCIVTDPPYGLGFMGKEWDAGLPHAAIWSEALRVLKPGAHILCFGGTRTYHRLTCAIEDSGFEIRDCLMWLYGSGFPKSHNFGKKLGAAWDGYGTALKPSYEPIILAMKPVEVTFASNAGVWGVSGLNIDSCRIESNGEHKKGPQIARGESFLNERKGMYTEGRAFIPTDSDKGRWPSNTLFDEEAAMILDEQSGFSVSRPDKRSGQLKSVKDIYGSGFKHAPNHVNDSGGASRFFYCAKASSSERNEGLEALPLVEMKRTQDGGDDTRGRPTPKNHNIHPTVKPLKLMEYLIKLVMPPQDGVLLDPFMGSGSTILAAQNLKVKSIGIEKQREYYEIAAHRVNNNQKMDLF